MAFWALAEIVRQRLSIAEEDPAEAAAGKLAAGLAEFVPDPAERAYAGVRLGRLPGMPGPARAKITAQAQGIPLFGVETIRSLIDRDVVQPVEGIYRLVGDVGHLAVPDSLHALLAARLDALDRGARRLVADAAVLGSTFPAEALIAVSGQDEPVVRAALDELVRREVLSVSDGYTRRRHRAGLITEGGVESGRPQPSRRFRHFG